MRRIVAVATAAFIAFVLAVLPVGATPAQAVEAVRSFGCLSSVDPKCAGANLPFLVEAGIASAGGSTVATGGTAAVVASSTATGAGVTGFGSTWAAAGAATAGGIGMGLLSVQGLESGVYIETDPEYTHATLPGFDGPAVFPELVLWGAGSTGAEVVITRFEVDLPYGATSGAQTTLRVAGTISGHCANAGWVYPSIGVLARTAGSTGGSSLLGNVSIGGACSNGAASASFDISQLVTLNLSGQPAPLVLDTLVLTAGAVVSGGTAGTSRLAWYPEGHPLRSDAPSADYDGQLRTTVTCSDGAATQTVESFADIVGPAGSRFDVPPAVCPPGWVAISVAVDYQEIGSSLWVGLGSAMAPGEVVDLPIHYPDCFGSAVNSCKLELQTKSASDQWESCGPLAEFCLDWVRQASETPDLWRCRYGGTTLDLSYCSAFRSPGVLLPNHEPDTHGEPQRLPITAPVPETLPNPVRGPDGEPVESFPWIDTDGSNSPDSRECFPTGWGVLNPVSWVLMPVQCALRWAFVPRASEIALRLEELRFRVNGWVAPVVTIVTAITASIDVAASGCQGPPLRLNLDFGTFGGVDETFYPMDACDAPMDAVASAVNGMISFSVIAFTGLAVVRYFMTIFGYVPFGSANTGSSVMFRETGD